MPPVVEAVALDLGVVAGIVVSLGILARSRPGKAVLGLGRRTWRRAFGQPFTTWAQSLVRDAVRPEIEALRAENSEQHGQTAQALTDVSDELGDVNKRVAVIEHVVKGHDQRLDRGTQRMDAIGGQIGDIFTALGELKVTVAGLTAPIQPPDQPSAQHPPTEVS
jgi:hypothetical protein